MIEVSAKPPISETMAEVNAAKVFSSRIASIDILRGIIIVIMGLDHVRHFVSITPFAPEDLSQTTPALFFTRWITHYCAPVFVLLAGMSAFLYGEKIRSKKDLSLFLITRGIWLIAIEILAINLGWKFSYDWFFLQVIWVIGCSMLILSWLVWLPVRAIAVFAFVLIAGHNLLDGIQANTILWSLLHVPGEWILPVLETRLLILYPLIPWPGVMAAGYVLGQGMLKPEADRRKYFTLAGTALILLFVGLRFTNVYGDPQAWSVQERGGIYTLLSFLNTTKYPPSLLYLCMTIGPALLVLPYLEKLITPVANFFLAFGKVPFFYYILHIPIIHVIAIMIGGIRYGHWKSWLFDNPDQWPAAYVPSLLLTFYVWAAITILLFYCCKWFASVKKRRKDWWLKYL